MTNVFHRTLKSTPPNAIGGQGVYLFDNQGNKYLDASGGAAYIKFASIEGEVLDESHKEWDDVISIGTPINEPTTREVSDDDLEIKR